MTTELRHDIERSRRNDLLRERETRVKQIKDEWMTWFEDNPSKFWDYLLEEEQLDIGYNLVMLEGQKFEAGQDGFYACRDIVRDIREKVAERLAEAEVEDPVFDSNIY